MPRAWHKSFPKALASVDCVASKLDDQCVYMCRSRDGVLQDITALHVDDMVCGGALPFKYFKKKAGDFLGRFLRQEEDFSIKVSQKDYAEGLEFVRVSRHRRRRREPPVTEEERKQTRVVLGELNWLVSSSRPDLAAFCSLLQQRVNNACVKDLVEVNKAVAMARDFSCVGGGEVVKPIPEQDVEFCVWSDALWANPTEKKSQRGYIIAAVPSALRKESWAVEVLQARQASCINVGCRTAGIVKGIGGNKVDSLDMVRVRGDECKLHAGDQRQVVSPGAHHSMFGLQARVRS